MHLSFMLFLFTMQFSSIIGQKSVKEKLINTVKENRVSHAQLFLGNSGSGNLPLAIAYAQYIACTDKGMNDSCGNCNSCTKFQKLAHPDLHFAFPVATNKRVKEKPTSKDYISEWREAILHSPYLNLYDWLKKIEVENKQGMISVHESADIIKALSYKTYEAEYKTLIIWMPEKMNTFTANKLLKQIEEPEQKTLILLVAEDEEQIISTIRSRTQLVKIPIVDQESMRQFLISERRMDPEESNRIALLSNGNVKSALQLLEQENPGSEYFTQFKSWMRVSWKADIEGIHAWVEEMSSKNMGREKQKGFMEYALMIVRDSILVNFGDARLSKLQNDEKDFLKKFSPFVHSSNVLEIVDILNTAHYHIERNANPKILFMDLSLKFANLLHVKNVTL